MIELDHTIVHATDRDSSAAFLAGILGLSVGAVTGPFRPVQVGGVTLDFARASAVSPQHYAFRVDGQTFDAALARIRASGTGWWADPHRREPHEVGRRGGSRAVYFADPDDHSMEIFT